MQLKPEPNPHEKTVGEKEGGGYKQVEERREQSMAM